MSEKNSTAAQTVNAHAAAAADGSVRSGSASLLNDVVDHAGVGVLPQEPANKTTRSLLEWLRVEHETFYRPMLLTRNRPYNAVRKGVAQVKSGCFRGCNLAGEPALSRRRARRDFSNGKWQMANSRCKWERGMKAKRRTPCPNGWLRGHWSGSHRLAGVEAACGALAHSIQEPSLTMTSTRIPETSLSLCLTKL